MTYISHKERAALRACLHIARTSSDDAETRTACVLMTPHCTLYSSNRLPAGVHWRSERTRRPVKYNWIEHAERLAVFHAARMGLATDGATAVLPWYPCVDCGRIMLLAGIKRVVSSCPDFRDERWGEDFIEVERLFSGRSIETAYSNVAPDTGRDSIASIVQVRPISRRWPLPPIDTINALIGEHVEGGILVEDDFLPVPANTTDGHHHPAYRLFGHAAKTGHACEGGHFVSTAAIDTLAARASVAVGCSSVFGPDISPDAQTMLKEAQIPFCTLQVAEHLIKKISSRKFPIAKTSISSGLMRAYGGDT